MSPYVVVFVQNDSSHSGYPRTPSLSRYTRRTHSSGGPSDYGIGLPPPSVVSVAVQTDEPPPLDAAQPTSSQVQTDPLPFPVVPPQTGAAPPPVPPPLVTCTVEVQTDAAPPPFANPAPPPSLVTCTVEVQTDVAPPPSAKPAPPPSCAVEVQTDAAPPLNSDTAPSLSCSGNANMDKAQIVSQCPSQPMNDSLLCFHKKQAMETLGTVSNIILRGFSRYHRSVCLDAV